MEDIQITCISEYKKVIEKNRKNNFFKNTFFTDSEDKFKINKHRDGAYPAVITISGFTSEDKDNRKNWEKSILTLFPDREWFHLEWNSKRNPFDEKEFSTMPTISEIDVKEKIFADIVSITNPMVLLKFRLANNIWHTSVRNSERTAELLAKVLQACNTKEFILVGHSLGARIIFNCLKFISLKDKKANIYEVHLLGGAIGIDKLAWDYTSKKVTNNIYNYYSTNDMILTGFYEIGVFSNIPIGITEIDNEKVVNINSSDFVSGHDKHIENFYKSKTEKFSEREVINYPKKTIYPHLELFRFYKIIKRK